MAFVLLVGKQSHCFFLAWCYVKLSSLPCLCYFLRLTALSKWPTSTRDICLCLASFKGSLWRAFLGHLLACGSSKIVYWALLSKPYINQSAHCSPEWVWCCASSACGIRSSKLHLLQIRKTFKKEGLVLQWCSLSKVCSCLFNPLMGSLGGQSAYFWACLVCCIVLLYFCSQALLLGSLTVHEHYFFPGLLSEWAN